VISQARCPKYGMRTLIRLDRGARGPSGTLVAQVMAASSSSKFLKENLFCSEELRDAKVAKDGREEGGPAFRSTRVTGLRAELLETE
jgi:hypothetical protein